MCFELFFYCIFILKQTKTTSPKRRKYLITIIYKYIVIFYDNLNKMIVP